MSNKKVCHIITTLGSGGAQATLCKLVTNDSYHNHIVIAMHRNGHYAEFLKNKGIDVIEFDFKRKLLFFYNFIRLLLLIKKIKPDIIQTWLYHADLIGGIAGKICNVKSIIWNIRTSYLPEDYKASTYLIIRICAILSWIIPCKILTCARSVIPIHQNYGYCCGKFYIIHNGFKIPGKYSKKYPSFLRTSNRDYKSFNIINIGRYAPQKDHRNFLKAIELFRENHKSLNFLVINILFLGSQTNKILKENKWFNPKNLNINVYTVNNTEDVYKYIMPMDLSVLCSAYGEAFPNVLAESMICGVPCIATNVGDSRNIIQDQGWIVEPRNSLALSNSIYKAINSLSKDNKSISKNCKLQIINNFNLKKMCNKYREFYSSQ